MADIEICQVNVMATVIVARRTVTDTLTDTAATVVMEIDMENVVMMTVTVAGTPTGIAMLLTAATGKEVAMWRETAMVHRLVKFYRLEMALRRNDLAPAIYLAMGSRVTVIVTSCRAILIVTDHLAMAIETGHHVTVIATDYRVMVIATEVNVTDCLSRVEVCTIYTVRT